jgi:hypothetical protein
VQFGGSSGTDAREIFRIVTPQRGAVLAAARLQLIAATLYVSAMIGIIRAGVVPFSSKGWRPASVLVVGTPGLATDAIDHLLSNAMTAPGVDQNAQVQVMELIQGPELLLIAPLIASFFVGGVAFSRVCQGGCHAPQTWIGALVTRHPHMARGQPGQPARAGPKHLSREQRMQEDTSVRSSSDGCAKVKA